MPVGGFLWGRMQCGGTGEKHKGFKAKGKVLFPTLSD